MVSSGDERMDAELEKLESLIQDIQETVHKLDTQKQDRVKPGTLITFLVYLLSQLLVGVWWASSTTATLDKVLEKIEDAGKDRFFGKDGKSMREHFELSQTVQNRQIDHNLLMITTHNNEAIEYKKIINQMQATQARMQEQLNQAMRHIQNVSEHSP